MINNSSIENENDYFENFDMPMIENMIQDLANSGRITKEQCASIWETKRQHGEVW